MSPTAPRSRRRVDLGVADRVAALREQRRRLQAADADQRQREPLVAAITPATAGSWTSASRSVALRSRPGAGSGTARAPVSSASRAVSPVARNCTPASPTPPTSWVTSSARDAVGDCIASAAAISVALQEAIPIRSPAATVRVEIARGGGAERGVRVAVDDDRVAQPEGLAQRVLEVGVHTRGRDDDRPDDPGLGALRSSRETRDCESESRSAISRCGSPSSWYIRATRVSMRRSPITSWRAP